MTTRKRRAPSHKGHVVHVHIHTGTGAHKARKTTRKRTRKAK